MRTALLLVALTACGARSSLDIPGQVTDGGTVDEDVTVPPPPSNFSFVLTAQPTSISITQGQAGATIQVHVQRQGGFVGAVGVDLAGLSPGLIGTTATIAPAATDASITLSASPASDQGTLSGISVRGTTVDAGQQLVPLGLYVRGCPGCLDKTFAVKGMAAVPGGLAPSTMTIDALDRIVVGGSFSDGSSAGVLRLTKDGAVDVTYGTTGIGRIPVPDGVPQAVVTDSAGAATLVGFDSTGTDIVFFTRLDVAGNLDLTFGSSGLVTFLIPTGTLDSLVRYPDGSVVAAGARDDSPEHVFLVKLLSSGAFDPSFGTSGQLVTTWGAGDSAAGPVVRLINGQLVAAGSAYVDTTSTNFSAALARYQPSGTLDGSFGTSGTSIGPLGFNLSDMISAQNGEIWVGGQYHSVTIARYSADGALDTSLGTNGVLSLDPFSSGQGSFAQYLVEQTDGKIIVVGSELVAGIHFAVFIARLNAADGSYDKPFGTAGVTKVQLGYDTYHTGVGVQSDGRIVLAGGYIKKANDPSTAFVARYWP